MISLLLIPTYYTRSSQALTGLYVFSSETCPGTWLTFYVLGYQPAIYHNWVNVKEFMTISHINSLRYSWCSYNRRTRRGGRIRKQCIEKRGTNRPAGGDIMHPFHPEDSSTASTVRAFPHLRCAAVTVSISACVGWRLLAKILNQLLVEIYY